MNFHTTVSGQAMVTMIYHKKLDEAWTAAAQKLRKVLGACPSSSQPSVHIVGRSRKQKIELDASHVIETLNVDGKQLTYKQVHVLVATSALDRSAGLKGLCDLCTGNQSLHRRLPSPQNGAATGACTCDMSVLMICTAMPMGLSVSQVCPCVCRLKGRSVSQMEACVRRC